MSIPYTLYLKYIPEENIGSLPDLFKILRDLNGENKLSDEDITKKRQELIDKLHEKPQEWNNAFQRYKEIHTEVHNKIKPQKSENIVFEIFPQKLNFFDDIILTISPDKFDYSKDEDKHLDFRQLKITNRANSDDVFHDEKNESGSALTDSKQKKINGCRFENIDFSNAFFFHTSFAYCQFKNVSFEGCVFEDVNLSHADIQDTKFVNCQFKNVSFKGAHLPHVSFPFCTLQLVDFRHAHLENSSFRHTNLEMISFNGAHLDDADLTLIHLENGRFRKAHLTGAKLSRAYLLNADFTSSDLTKCNLSYATILASDFWCAKLNEVRGWWAQMKKSDFFQADLTNAKFIGADLSYSIFGMAPMSGVSFNSANLKHSEFWSSNLRGADFKYANLDNTYFSNALPLSDIENPLYNPADAKTHSDLTGAEMKEASICNADFQDIILSKVDFSNSILDGTNFQGALLKKANLTRASLKNVNFKDAKLQGADLSYANISGARLESVKINSTIFKFVTVDGQTVISISPEYKPLHSENNINSKTDFSGVSLASIHMTPRVQAYLERNVREINWSHWYKTEKVISSFQYLKNKILKQLHIKTKKRPKVLDYNEWKVKPGYLLANTLVNIPVKCFWKISNYGGSTWTIFAWFFAINLLFHFVYLLCAILEGTAITVSLSGFLIEYIKTIITGLDITEATPSHMFILGTLHRICTYFILAALATRIGVLFRHLSP